MAARLRELAVNMFFAAGFFAGVAAIYWSRLQGEFADLIAMMAGAYAATWFAVGWRRLRQGPPRSSTARLFVVSALVLLAFLGMKAAYYWHVTHQPITPLEINMTPPSAEESNAGMPWHIWGLLAAVFIPAAAPWLVMIFSPRYRAFRRRAVLGPFLMPLAPLPVIIVTAILMSVPLR